MRISEISNISEYRAKFKINFILYNYKTKILKIIIAIAS